MKDKKFAFVMEPTDAAAYADRIKAIAEQETISNDDKHRLMELALAVRMLGWRVTADPNKAIEHDRSRSATPQPAQPVRVPSNKEICSMAEKAGVWVPLTGDEKEKATKALRRLIEAMLHRYGQAPTALPAKPVKALDWPKINEAIAKRFPDDPANAARAQAAIADVMALWPATSAEPVDLFDTLHNAVVGQLDSNGIAMDAQAVVRLVETQVAAVQDSAPVALEPLKVPNDSDPRRCMSPNPCPGAVGTTLPKRMQRRRRFPIKKKAHGVAIVAPFENEEATESAKKTAKRECRSAGSRHAGPS